jgi:4-carboxymuconolactone decarboxylase
MGLSKQEIVEILTHVAFYAGVPTAVNAFQLAKEVFKEEGV